MIPSATAYSAIGGMDVYRVLEKGVEVELPERDEEKPKVMCTQKDGTARLDEPNLFPVVQNPIRLNTLMVEMLQLSEPYQRKKVRTGALGGALFATSGEVRVEVRGQNSLTLFPGHLALLSGGANYLVNPIAPSRAVFLNLAQMGK
jgi:hypothetical protein